MADRIAASFDEFHATRRVETSFLLQPEAKSITGRLIDPLGIKRGAIGSNRVVVSITNKHSSEYAWPFDSRQ
jgi:hypothetical protein